MIGFGAFLLAHAGFAALSLSMDRHHRDLFGVSASSRRAWALRCLGWTLLALSFATCIADSGWAIGPVLWFGLLTVGALAVTLFLAFWPAHVKKRPAETS